MGLNFLLSLDNMEVISLYLFIDKNVHKTNITW